MPRIKEIDDKKDLKDLIWSMIDQRQMFKGVCQLCGKELERKKAKLHHTKYEGATFYDLRIVCHKCNTSSENRGLL